MNIQHDAFLPPELALNAPFPGLHTLRLAVVSGTDLGASLGRSNKEQFWGFHSQRPLCKIFRITTNLHVPRGAEWSGKGLFVGYFNRWRWGRRDRRERSDSPYLWSLSLSVSSLRHTISSVTLSFTRLFFHHPTCAIYSCDLTGNSEQPDSERPKLCDWPRFCTSDRTDDIHFVGLVELEIITRPKPNCVHNKCISATFEV
jgi:hypothetical protein